MQEYANDLDAEDAIHALNGTLFQGARLILQHSKNSRSKYARDYRNKSKMRCFNCQKPGHHIKDCKEMQK